MEIRKMWLGSGGKKVWVPLLGLKEGPLVLLESGEIPFVVAKVSFCVIFFSMVHLISAGCCCPSQCRSVSCFVLSCLLFVAGAAGVVIFMDQLNLPRATINRAELRLNRFIKTRLDVDRQDSCKELIRRRGKSLLGACRLQEAEGHS
ncbi:hypothetical protein ILYODFUR_015140 [Ilyodon furcidens]|uniref:Uncharacterized protein n=1 Tax=Ilyodon furcidens TaxID=33524 RepID=A0ABV0T850_9TELE